MSTRATVWAWSIHVPPLVKIVLMALSDIADDQGVCWPSIHSLSEKCCLADNAVKQIVILLQAKQLLWIAPRCTSCRSPATSCYRLAIDGFPDPLQSAGEADGDDQSGQGTGGSPHSNSAHMARVQSRTVDRSKPRSSTQPDSQAFFLADHGKLKSGRARSKADGKPKHS